VLAEAAGDEVATAALLRAGSELWLVIDDDSGAVTDAYRDAVAERARTDAQTRGAMLDVLLRGEEGEGSRLWECATALRLPRQGTYVVAVAKSPRPGVEAVPRAEEALRGKGVRSAWRVEVDAHVGVLVLTARTGIGVLSGLLAEFAAGPVGLSEPYHSLDATPAALYEARLACAAATGPAPVRYGDAPVGVLLASAPEAASAVARAVLGPVLALPADECDLLLGTVRAWFAADGATSVAAAGLHVHRNTVRYRLRRVEELTGRSLTRPAGIAELHLALEAVRLGR